MSGRRPALAALVVAPLASSLAPACLLATAATVSDSAWAARALIGLLGTVPLLGAAVAFVHAGAAGARVVRPLIPYAAAAAVFAVATWLLLLWSKGFEHLFAGYLVAILALPVLALGGCYGVLSRVSSLQT